MFEDGKKSSTTAGETATAKVQTMPAEFYGGINPVIRFKKVEKEVVLNRQASLVPKGGIRPAEKTALDTATAAGAGKKTHPANFLANRKVVFIGAAVLFVVFTGGSLFYYFGQRPNSLWFGLNKSKSPSVIVKPPVIEEQSPVVSPATSTEEAPPPKTELSAPVTPLSLSLATLEFPSKLLGYGIDSDNDGLSDAAEENFGSDPSLPDTDMDGYIDSEEARYLYDPAVTAPARLISGGKVTEFNNPFFGYQIYYPQKWILGNIDPGYSDILFSYIDGESVELKVFDLAAGQTFEEWFAKMAPGESLGDLRGFESYFGAQGKERDDSLVYYFMDISHIYVLLYHTLGMGPAEQRAVIDMMARSFRLSIGNEAGAGISRP